MACRSTECTCSGTGYLVTLGNSSRCVPASDLGSGDGSPRIPCALFISQPNSSYATHWRTPRYATLTRRLPIATYKRHHARVSQILLFGDSLSRQLFASLASLAGAPTWSHRSRPATQDTHKHVPPLCYTTRQCYSVHTAGSATCAWIVCGYVKDLHYFVIAPTSVWPWRASQRTPRWAATFSRAW